MKRLVASMLAIAIAICFTISTGCSPAKETGKTKSAGASSASTAPSASEAAPSKDFAIDGDVSGDVKKGEAKTFTVKVKNGEIKEITVDPKTETSKVSATKDGDKAKVEVAKDAPVGEVKIKIMAKEGDKTATFTVKIKE